MNQLFRYYHLNKNALTKLLVTLRAFINPLKASC